MSKMLAIAILGLGFAFSASAAEVPATNAVITDVEGTVSVNQGEEFVPATEGMRLKPGDRIMVPDDSQVEISYDDNCRYEVDENRIATVQARSTCAGGALVEQGLNPAGARAIGASASTTNGPGNVAGGLIVAAWAAIGYCWLKCDEDDDEDAGDTVSP